MAPQLEQPEQADAELLTLVAHRDASAALCLAGLSAVLQQPRCGALKPAADIVLERFARDAAVALRLVEVLLGSDEKVGPTSEPLSCGCMAYSTATPRSTHLHMLTRIEKDTAGVLCGTAARRRVTTSHDDSI